MSIPFSFSSFFSKNINCFDVVKALYLLTENDVEVLVCINHLKPVSISDLEHIIPKDRSTLHRSINKLHTIGLVRREKVNLPKGGYQFQYYSLEMDDLRNLIEEEINKITSNMISALNSLSKENCELKFIQIKEKYSSKKEEKTN